jgi:DNA mismatch repair protein MSH2
MDAGSTSVVLSVEEAIAELLSVTVSKAVGCSKKRKIDCLRLPQVGAKRKRVSGPDDTARGAARVRAFLRDFASLPIDQMSPDEAVKAAEDLKMSLEQDAAVNPWLQQIL